VVPDNRATEVVESWIRHHVEEYESSDSEPLFRSPECLSCFRSLFGAAREASHGDAKLVWIWTL
jgi:hypothetical protein